MRTLILLFSFCLFLFSACTYENEDELFDSPITPQILDTAGGVKVTYLKDVKPILETRCNFTGCHASGTPARQGDFSSYNGVKAKVDNNTFKKEVIDTKRMPLGNPPLPKIEIDILRAWLEDGALEQ